MARLTRTNDSFSPFHSHLFFGHWTHSFRSGLAVEPNNNNSSDNDDILGTIRSNAEEAQPSSPSSGDATRRMITMYRSGFTIDDGPFRRLDDPNNGAFLRDLARGITPSELFEDDGTGGNRDMEVGLVDKRHMEYEEDEHRSASSSATARRTSSTTTAAFSGVGQSLGSSTSTSTGMADTSAAGGIVTPNMDGNASDRLPPKLDDSKPTTTIQIRLLNGKKLKVKCNTDDTVQTLVLHIEAAGGGGSGGDSYVLSSGYPPRVLGDLNKSIEECGLKGAQVVQKKA